MLIADQAAQRRGLSSNTVGNPTCDNKAKKRLIATLPNSEFELSNCNHNDLHFSNRNTIRLSGNIYFSALLHPKWKPRACLLTLSRYEGCGKSPSRLYPSNRGARMSHSIIQRSAIPGGVIQ
jgi:hypothetical protein